MIGMQHGDLVHRLLDDRIQNIFLRRDSKQHLQEISGIGEIVARIRGGLLNGVLVAHGGDSGHFRQQPGGGQRPVLRIFHIQYIMIERRQRPHRAHISAIGCESRRKPLHMRAICSWTRVWRVMVSRKV